MSFSQFIPINYALNGDFTEDLWLGNFPGGNFPGRGYFRGVIFRGAFFPRAFFLAPFFPISANVKSCISASNTRIKETANLKHLRLPNKLTLVEDRLNMNITQNSHIFLHGNNCKIPFRLTFYIALSWLLCGAYHQIIKYTVLTTNI